ncbi:hypothetical protein [Actinophytocola sp.]|uniref:hypothetical protein n=1 Tax=Actinophytocola sp. TaxID=1872138 RepID=UPI002ECFC61E
MPGQHGQQGWSGQPGWTGQPAPGQPGWTGQPAPGQPDWTGQPAPGQAGWTGQAMPGQQGWSGQPAWQGVAPMPPVGGGGYGQTGWAIKPGVIPLRPLGLGEILDGAISTMRRHPKLMLGVAAIVVTVTQLIVLAATYPLLDDLGRAATLDPNNTTESELWSIVGASLAVTGISIVLLIVSRVFLSGFVTAVVGSAVLGQSLSVKEVWTKVRSRMLPLLGLTLIYPAIMIGVVFIVVMVTALVPPLGVLLILGLIPVGIWLWVMFCLATPALVLENARVGQAFGRSRRLVSGSWWRIFGITLLAAVIAFFLAFVISVPFEAFGGGFTFQAAPLTTEYLVLSTAGGIIASTLTEPFAAAVIALLYTDQRMRREGLDIELARAAGTQ